MLELEKANKFIPYRKYNFWQMTGVPKISQGPSEI